MPRDGSKKRRELEKKHLYRNNVSDIEGHLSKGEDLASILEAGLYWIHFAPVKTDDECAERLNMFFQRIMENNEYPTVEKMSLALGVDSETVRRWERGDLGGIRSALIKRAKTLIANMDAELAAKQKISPVVYIFRAKNFYGMRDQVNVVSEAKTDNSEGLTDEDIMKSIVKEQ